MQTPRFFGQFERVADYQVSFPGVASLDCLLHIMALIAQESGMRTDGPPDIRIYPNGDGDGGIGVQIYQAWVESFLVIGTWPEGGFIRIYMASCKDFDESSIRACLNRHVGRVTHYLGGVLGAGDTEI